MALNKFMHKRNPFYNNPPDFKQMAQLYPEFEKYCILSNGNFEINFKSSESLKALACVLLKHLFSNSNVAESLLFSMTRSFFIFYYIQKDLKVDMPLNHLIPRVPQRINYVLWIEDLIKKPGQAIGIDIGTFCSFRMSVRLSNFKKIDIVYFLHVSMASDSIRLIR